MHDPLIDGVDKQALNEGHGGQAESGKRNQRGDDRVVPLQKGQDQGGQECGALDNAERSAEGGEQGLLYGQPDHR